MRMLRRSFVMAASPPSTAGGETSDVRRVSADSLAKNQAGLTLYEVVLALVIFLGALLALGQLIATGSRAAIRSRLQTQAILLCDSKLCEVLAGIEPMQAAASVPFDSSDSNWFWSLDVVQGPTENLLLLELTVSHMGENKLSDASSSISRYVSDPQFSSESSDTDSATEELVENGE